MLLALCVACGDREEDAEIPTEPQRTTTERDTEAAPSTAADDRPDPEGTVVIALRRVPASLDPVGALEPWGMRLAEDVVFEGLVARSSAAHPWIVPALADRCVTDDDAAPKTVFCHLRSDARFHDGQPVAMEDVVYTFERWLDPRRVEDRRNHGLSSLVAVAVVDDPGPSDGRDPGRWLRIDLSRPEPLALEQLSRVLVVPRKHHRSRAAFGRNPIGSGPMRVASMSPDHLVLERVEGRSTGAARIVLRAFPDGAHALTALRRGEVHVVADVSPIHVPDELAKAGMAARFQGHVLTPPRYDVLLYNLRRGVQAGPRLREAIHLAVPRATLTGKLHDGRGLLLEAPVDLWPPTSVDLDALARLGAIAGQRAAGLPEAPDASVDVRDSERAVALLDELGWTLERGLRRRTTGPLRLVLMWDGATGLGHDTARMLREAWVSVGIQVPYATAPWSYLRGPIHRGEFEVALGRLADNSDADLLPWFHSKGESNVTGVSDAELDRALEGYRAARTRNGRDGAKLAIAGRLAALRPVSVLHAPVEIMLSSRRITELFFMDDLPQLAHIAVRPESRDGW